MLIIKNLNLIKLLGYQVLSPLEVEVARFPIGFRLNFSIFQSPPRPSFNITCSFLFFQQGQYCRLGNIDTFRWV